MASAQSLPLLYSQGWEGNGVVSPDGHWLAYECCDVSSLEIQVRPYPNVQAGGGWQVSNGGGRRPMWSPAGNELFFVASDGTMMRVSVDVSGSVWHPDTPARVFPAGFSMFEFASRRNRPMTSRAMAGASWSSRHPPAARPFRRTFC